MLWYRLHLVTNAILTELPKLSSSNIRVYISENQRRTKGKGKDGFKRVDNPNTREFREKGKGKHTGSGKSGTSAHHANLTSVEDYDYYNDEDLDESANACQAHHDPIDPGSDDGEEALDCDDDEENDTLIALDDVAVHKAAELDAIALLAVTWYDDFDPETSAQLVQASAQAYLSFRKDKGTGKGKGKGMGKGRYPERPSHLSLEDPTTTPERTKSEDRVSNLRSEVTLCERPQLRNVFLQFVYTKSNTYSSHGHTTATHRPSESDWSVFFS